MLASVMARKEVAVVRLPVDHANLTTSTTNGAVSTKKSYWSNTGKPIILVPSEIVSVENTQTARSYSQANHCEANFTN